MSNEIFGRLKSAGAKDEPGFLVDDNARWIARKDDKDASLMADAEVTILPLGMRSFASRISFDGERYFCFSGLPVPDFLPDGFEQISATPGLFGAVFVNADLPVTATAAEIRDAIEEQHRGVEGYQGHDLQTVLDLFQEVDFFRVASGADSIFLESLERVCGSYCARGYPGYPLGLSSMTLSSITELFESGHDTLPYHLPLQGLLSYTWPAFYLELYRCIEQLYSVPRLQVLRKRLAHAGPIAELASTLESIISWRPREQESLSAILSKISEGRRASILSSFSLSADTVPTATGHNCAEKIYQLRNAHVHFRPALSAPLISAEEWDRIIYTMCVTVIEVYDLFGDIYTGNSLDMA
ncbi:hypothetical protein [Jiella sp. M17.18]|uniref:hypothetical protein n=1 Tax=Jiella sp. M17.18 TaxID=3234247 RepID=UPI0034DF4E72